MPRRSGDAETLWNEEINQNLFGGGGVSENEKRKLTRYRRGAQRCGGAIGLWTEIRGEMLLSSGFLSFKLQSLLFSH